MSSQPRPVWLTKDQRRHLTQMGSLADRHDGVLDALGYPHTEQA